MPTDNEKPPVEMVTISKAEYDRLIRVDNWMDILEQAGIDNAEAYDYACQLRQEAIARGEYEADDF